MQAESRLRARASAGAPPRSGTRRRACWGPVGGSVLLARNVLRVVHLRLHGRAAQRLGPELLEHIVPDVRQPREAVRAAVEVEAGGEVAAGLAPPRADVR